jgi:hypothetical protein
MASIGRLVKRRDSAVDDKDAELAARAARKSQERHEAEEAAAAAKLAADANDKPHNVFSSGVFRMLDDDYVDKDEDSPVVQRRTSDGKPDAYPMGSTGGGVMGAKKNAPA